MLKSSSKSSALDCASHAARRTRRARRGVVSAVVVVVALTGCERGVRAEASGVVAPAGRESAIWTGRSPSGATIQVRREPEQLEAASTIRFEISVGGADSDGAITADLVSPDMPSHGVTRYEATRLRPGVFTIELAVPMEGRWELYVNLDDGFDAVAFPFDVTARAGSGQTQQAASQERDAQQHPH